MRDRLPAPFPTTRFDHDRLERLMKLHVFLILGCSLVALPGCSKSPGGNGNMSASAAAPLKFASSVDLPGYTGDFDHFAIDAKDGRVFLAGEESAELEVFDRNSGKIIQRMKGFGVPHSVLYMPDAGEVLVVDGEKPSPVFDAASLELKRTYKLPLGADSVGFDSASGHLWVVTGGKDVKQKDSNLVEIDPATGKIFKSVHFDADHVEAMAVEQHGPDIFINITDKNELAVVDKASGKIVKQIPIREAEQNAPIAIDEASHRLFVVTRKPGKLIVLNADTGQTIAVLPAAERTDEVVWDPDNRRVYVAGGQGYISVVQQDAPDKYREIARVTSLPGAKTEILDSEGKHLWVAASPGESKAMAKVLRFDVMPR
jgi:DNA-binding beta-propeller fold protein YncE